ncbi:hypothetical protein KOW79_007746 [Hemibagrus wyckioides]|uniref:Uncharacterized protein n=1 Tax=Hemibagrus wyckioides TaxID=337641 RepID=A0A9D3SMH3_9TELE|nr:hypothetical protein KOW79_007746 [Hemibagrus wyckioides]
MSVKEIRLRESGEKKKKRHAQNATRAPQRGKGGLKETEEDVFMLKRKERGNRESGKTPSKLGTDEMRTSSTHTFGKEVCLSV